MHNGYIPGREPLPPGVLDIINGYADRKKFSENMDSIVEETTSISNDVNDIKHDAEMMQKDIEILRRDLQIEKLRAESAEKRAKYFSIAIGVLNFLLSVLAMFVYDWLS